MNDDEAPRRIDLASKRERDALDEWVERVLRALGADGALVTDESLISDFLDTGGTPHRYRRGWSGPWIESPGDPAIRHENDQLLARASSELGVMLAPEDHLVDVARRVRHCGRA